MDFFSNTKSCVIMLTHIIVRCLKCPGKFIIRINNGGELWGFFSFLHVIFYCCTACIAGFFFSCSFFFPIVLISIKQA